MHEDTSPFPQRAYSLGVAVTEYKLHLDEAQNAKGTESKEPSFLIIGVQKEEE